MPSKPLHALPDEDVLCDVCLVGSGPAGATIARELQSTRLRIVVVEGGGRHREPLMDELNRIESVDAPKRVADQWLERNRILGGMTHTCTGRCAPFDEIDFERRDWVAESGWLFGLDELKPYLEHSATPPASPSATASPPRSFGI